MHANISRPRVYLAGPGVFHPKARTLGDELKALCAEQRLDGLWPLDNAADLPNDRMRAAEKIFVANTCMIEAAEAVVADISPFRGPHMDPGTAFEIGMAMGRGKPVFAWSRDRRALLHRMMAMKLAGTAGLDLYQNQIEDFGLVDNLMIAVCVGRIYANPREAILAAAEHLHARALAEIR